MRIIPIISLLLLAGCAVTSTKMIPIKYQFLDIPDEQRIEISYTNTSRAALCLSMQEWPNSSGAFDQASNLVSLIVGDERFPVEDINTGYCPDCMTRVAPGEKISASIPYADFSLPEQLFDEPKKLDFSPEAFRCRAEK